MCIFCVADSNHDYWQWLIYLTFSLTSHYGAQKYLLGHRVRTCDVSSRIFLVAAGTRASANNCEFANARVLVTDLFVCAGTSNGAICVHWISMVIGVIVRQIDWKFMSIFLQHMCTHAKTQLMRPIIVYRQRHPTITFINIRTNKVECN